MGGVVSLKLPFTLVHRNTERDIIGFPSPIRDEAKTPTEIIEKKTEDKGNLSSIDKIHCKRVNQMLDVDLIENNDNDEII